MHDIIEELTLAISTRTPGTALDTVSYGYGDSEWSDLLTIYDGQTRTNDDIGNLLNDGTWQCTKQHGRQLAGMTDTSGNTLVYSCGSNRLRTEKPILPQKVRNTSNILRHFGGAVCLLRDFYKALYKVVLFRLYLLKLK